MDDLKISENFQELSQDEAESLVGGAGFFGNMVTGLLNFTNSIYDTTTSTLQFIDRGIGKVLNIPQALVRVIFGVKAS